MKPSEEIQLHTRIKLMDSLKDRIIYEARALLLFHATDTTPIIPTFNVIISKKQQDSGERDDPKYEYEALLIVYTTPERSLWKLVMCSSHVYESAVDAMEDLLESVYEKAGELYFRMDEGDVYTGEKAAGKRKVEENLHGGVLEEGGEIEVMSE